MADISTTLDNIVSHWEFEESSGTRVDSHGSNDLTDNNTVGQATGKQGNGADLERTNTEYLSISNAAQSGLKITGDMSVSMWLKVEDQVTSGTIEYQLYNRYQSAGNHRSFSLTYIYNGGTYAIQVITSANGSTIKYGNISQTFTPGTWYHLVAVYDASAGSVELYVNGSSIGTISGLDTALYADSAPVEIGAQSGAYTFDGVLDEVTVTSDVITSGEVTTIYNSGDGIPYLGGTTVSPSVQSLTFSLPAETVSGQASVSVTTQSATFSLPAGTVTADWTISPSIQVATFSIPSYIVSAGGIVLAPDAQTATFSLPAEQIVAGATLSPDAQVLTFSLPAESVTADWTVAVDPQVLTVSVPTLEFVGALWARASRNTGDWTRGARNDDG